ncbi:MAG: hypothetical protein ABJA93_07795 [Sporichthyaceae bacterium]
MMFRRVMTTVATAAAGLAACSLSLFSGERPVLTIGAASAVAVLGAVVSGWRWLASVAALTVTATVLFAAAVSSDRVTAWHLVGASALVVGLVAGLDRVERQARTPRPELIGLDPLGCRSLVPVLGVLAAAAVAVAADRPAVPSVGLVFLGLAAAVTALVLATSRS